MEPDRDNDEPRRKPRDPRPGRIGTAALLTVVMLALGLYFYYYVFHSSVGLGG